MKYEVEQKFPVGDLAAVESRLNDLGAKFGEPIRQIDRYFAHPERDFAKTDEALRLRRTGESNRITYKGPKFDETTKTRREIELSLPEGDATIDNFSDLLSALGFTRVTEVNKSRRIAEFTWGDHCIEASLDEVDEVGSFVELEIGATEESIESSRETVLQLAESLGLAESQRRGYLELLLENRRKRVADRPN